MLHTKKYVYILLLTYLYRRYSDLFASKAHAKAVNGLSYLLRGEPDKLKINRGANRVNSFVLIHKLCSMCRLEKNRDVQRKIPGLKGIHILSSREFNKNNESRSDQTTSPYVCALVCTPLKNNNEGSNHKKNR